MGKLLLILLLSIASHAEEKIRVRLTTLPLNVNVQGMGVVFEANKESYKKVALAKFENFQVSFQDETWNIESPSFSKKVKSPYLALEGDLMQINSSLVPSRVFLWPKGNSVDVIAVLNMEDYLSGVLPHEMPAVWPLEALKAQAVVARSFTLSQVKARKDSPYHLDSTVNDQVYKYLKNLKAEEARKIKLAIDSTREEILVDLRAKPVRALYHADCGGTTEKSSNVWGGKEVEFSVADPFCPHSENKSWSYNISKRDLAQKLGLSFQIKKIVKDSVSQSGRAQRVAVVGGLKSYNLSSQDLRQKIGYSKIRSTRFDIIDLGLKVHFQGTGFGHGVGLCQWGAKKWAQTGKDYKAILKHYFPGYTLKTL